MLPEFPIAKKAIAKSQEDFFQFACRRHSGGLLGNIPRRLLQEGNAMKQVYTKEMQFETQVTKLEAKFDVLKDDLKANPLIVYDKLYEAANDFAAQQALQFFKTISDVTELTGNVVNSKGEYKIEDFFESLEKVDIEFDDNGQPVFPQFVGSNTVISKIKAVLKQSEQDPANLVRMEQIVKRKKQEWDDRENSRKLVD